MRKSAGQAAESSTAQRKVKVARVKDAEETRRNILEEALREFSLWGLSGARVDRIADNTRTSKRMIYYYFESKDGLYLAALKECYRKIRELEAGFHLENLPPMVALRNLVEFTVDYHATHENFIRVIMTENIHNGEHIRRLPELKSLNQPTIEIIRKLCERGVSEGVFRANFDPVDLHMNISALAFFNVSNKHTFGYIFGKNLDNEKVHSARKREIVETVLRYVRDN